MRKRKLFICSVMLTSIVFGLLVAFASKEVQTSLVYLYMFTPAIIALIINKGFYKRSKKEMSFNYFWALGLLVILIGVIYGINILKVFMFAHKLALPNLDIITAIVAIVVDSVFVWGEEYGWRKFLFGSYSKVEQLNVVTNIKCSLIWSSYHIPIVIALNLHLLKHFDLFILLVFFQSLSVVGAGIIFNYFYSKISKFALLSVIIAHAMWNYINTQLNGDIYFNVKNVMSLFYNGEGILGAMILLVISSIILVISNKQYNEVNYLKNQDTN